MVGLKIHQPASVSGGKNFGVAGLDLKSLWTLTLPWSCPSQPLDTEIAKYMAQSLDFGL